VTVQTLRRVLALLTLVAAVMLVAAWLLASRARGRNAEQARALLQAGTPADLRTAADLLAAARGSGPCLAAAEALVRGQLAAEYGLDLAAAVAAVAAAEPERAGCSDLRVADGLVALAAGDRAAAAAALADARRFSTPTTLARHHHRWLAGMLSLGTGDDLAAAVAAADALVADEPRTVAYHRLLAALHLRAGRGDDALSALARIRGVARTHLGLAADEALANAALRREFSGVADLADQLLARSPPPAADDPDLAAPPGGPPGPARLGPELGPYDRGHALLARAVVHVHAGEAAAGLARADAAWPLLPWWDHAARALALDLSLEAGDATRVHAWLAAAAPPEPEPQIYQAWARLVDGDVMAALATLAELPQDHPRVAYLQGLALVEQRRFDEAEPWLARADRLLPGRVEVEVARARVAVHTGDRVTALRKLAGLAEEEVYAPRAWTGLGEAYLAAARPGDLSPGTDTLRAAQKALQRAVEREPRAAEAMLLLAQVWQRRRLDAPEAETSARQWFEQAAATNPALPRYREALARHLADTGEPARAEAMLRALVDAPGVEPTTPLVLADLVLDAAQRRGDPPPPEVTRWLAAAEALGADPAALARTRARVDLSLGTAASLRAAEAALSARLAREPGDVDARVLLVRVRVAQREDEAAENLLKGGIYTVGAGASGRLFLAWARLEVRQRKRKQAALHARAALRRMEAEGRPTVELLEAAELAVHLFSRTEQHKLATGITRELAARLPGSAQAQRLAARAELAAGEPGRARRALARALELAPGDPEALELQARLGGRRRVTAGAPRGPRPAVDP
jgi:tetratricopeptide (TPR) repeat protein